MEMAWFSYPDFLQFVQSCLEEDGNDWFKAFADLDGGGRSFLVIFEKEKASCQALLLEVQRAMEVKQNRFLCQLEDTLVSDYKGLLHQEELYQFQWPQSKWILPYLCSNSEGKKSCMYATGWSRTMDHRLSHAKRDV